MRTLASDVGEVLGDLALEHRDRGQHPDVRVGAEQRHEQLRRHRMCTAHWKREPARVRRWLTPTSFAPSRTTSPGPTPAKQISRGRLERALGVSRR